MVRILLIKILITLIMIDIFKILFGEWRDLMIPKLIREYIKQKSSSDSLMKSEQNNTNKQNGI